MTKQNKNHTLRKTLLTILSVALAFLSVRLILDGVYTSRSYSVVPNYDLMVREVAKGDETIRIVPMDAMPEGEYYYHVSYAGKWPGRPAEGYLIAPKRPDGIIGEGYRVQCHPADEYDLEPNITFLNIPMYLGETEPDKIKDGFWVKQIIFELDGYTYWVRFESRQGIVEGVETELQRMAASLIERDKNLWEAAALTGVWTGETQMSVLGEGVEAGQTADGTVTFTFFEDQSGVMEMDFGSEVPAVSENFNFTVSGDQLVLELETRTQTYTFAAEGNTLALDGRGDFVLKRET